MAPRLTRPNVRSSAPATRKCGESDPNVPPKKRKTRQSKGGSDEDREDERKDDDTDNHDREVGKRARRGKKAQ